VEKLDLLWLQECGLVRSLLSIIVSSMFVYMNDVPYFGECCNAKPCFL